MKRQIIMLALISGAVASCNCAGDQSHEVIRNESTVLDSIFLSETLQDTLSKFMADIDSFPNPYGPETFYDIIIRKNATDIDSIPNPNAPKKYYDMIIRNNVTDTIIELSAHGRFSAFMPYVMNVVVHKGAVKYGNKLVAVTYIGFKDLKFLVNEKILDTSLYYKYAYANIITADWDVHSSNRQYRLIGNDSLVLFRQRKSIYERD